MSGSGGTATNSSFANRYVGRRFFTLVHLPLFTLHRKCKTIRRLSSPVFWKSVLRLFLSTLYDSNGEMSEYLIVPLAKRQGQAYVRSDSQPIRSRSEFDDRHVRHHQLRYGQEGTRLAGRPGRGLRFPRLQERRRTGRPAGCLDGSARLRASSLAS